MKFWKVNFLKIRHTRTQLKQLNYCRYDFTYHTSLDCCAPGKYLISTHEIASGLGHSPCLLTHLIVSQYIGYIIDFCFSLQFFVFNMHQRCRLLEHIRPLMKITYWCKRHRHNIPECYFLINFPVERSSKPSIEIELSLVRVAVAHQWMPKSMPIYGIYTHRRRCSACAIYRRMSHGDAKRFPNFIITTIDKICFPYKFTVSEQRIYIAGNKYLLYVLFGT